MTVNHLSFGQSWLDYVTGGGRLWFSVAEGFVLISGIVFGIVYSRYLQEYDWEKVIAKVSARALQLYLVAIIWQTIAATLAYGFNWGIQIGESYWPAFLLSVFQIGDILTEVDLLPMYSLLLLWGLVVLYMLEKRKLIWVIIFYLHFGTPVFLYQIHSHSLDKTLIRQHGKYYLL